MHVTIATLTGSLYSSEDVAHIQVPTAAGEIGVYKNHQPLISVLAGGSVMVEETAGDKKYFTVARGVIEVTKEKVTILADVAEPSEEYEAEKIAIAKKEAQTITESTTVSDKEKHAAQKLSLIHI